MQTLRRAAKNTTYMFLNAEVERQQNIKNGGNPTYIVEYHETMNVWLTALTAFDIVMVLALAVAIGYRIRKNKLYHQQNKA